MGFITLNDGTVIHGSQLPILNGNIVIQPYNGCLRCDGTGIIKSNVGTRECTCKKYKNKNI